MIKYNSQFSEEQISFILQKRLKYRLYYALLFKHYEIHSEFFAELPKFSGSLITKFSEIFKTPRKLCVPSASVLIKYRNEIRNYHGGQKALNEELVQNYIFKLLYDQVVKYTVALKQGRTNAENIMCRFTRNNANHPVYKALSELGRAVKTIFLCKYLSSENLRQEIHEGLNVVERRNGINDFIFYGKRRTLTGNNSAEFELHMLCLHILQLSMVYINTLLLQQILTESNWLPRMTIADKRAISPLINEHINPYGQFLLDMNTRLPINFPQLSEVA